MERVDKKNTKKRIVQKLKKSMTLVHEAMSRLLWKSNVKEQTA